MRQGDPTRCARIHNHPLAPGHEPCSSGRVLRSRPLASTVALAAALSGCAGGLPTKIEGVDQQAVTESTGAAIEQTLDELQSPEQQRQIAEILASPAMQRAQAELVAGLVDGALDALSEDQRRARIRALADQIATAATAAMTEQLAKGIREDLAPVIAELVAAQAYAAGKQAVLGAEDALTEAEAKKKAAGKDEESALGGIGELAQRGANLILMIAIALGLAVVALLAWIAKLLAQAKRHKEEAREVEARTEASAEADREERGPGGAPSPAT